MSLSMMMNKFSIFMTLHTIYIYAMRILRNTKSVVSF